MLADREETLLSGGCGAIIYGEWLAYEARARLRAATEQLFGKPTVSDYPNMSEEDLLSLVK